MRAPRIRTIAFAAALLAFAPVSLLCFEAQAGQPVVLEVSEELLQDGFDALKDRRPDLARQIFQSLLTSHPSSPAARKAAAELAKLDPAAVEAIGSEATGAGDDAFGEKPSDEKAEQMRKLRFRLVSEVGDRVFFAESSAVIGGRARAILEAQARWLKKSPSIAVTIVGRADDGGASADATALARQRAEVVRAKLIEGGVPGERIRIETRGNSDPVATCRTPLCQAQNRHAETRLRLPVLGDSDSGLAGGDGPATYGAEAIAPDDGRATGQSLAR